MMTATAERRDLIHYACERCLKWAVRDVREAKYHGAAGIWIEECLTDLIRPKDYRLLGLKWLRPLVEEIRSAGLASIHYFCGDPSGRWDLLLDSGADALSLEESKKGFVIDIEDVAERVAGRCAILGNLDAIGTLQDGSEEALGAEIARQIAAGRRNGSRFVTSLGSPVTPGTPVDRVRLYCEMARATGMR